MVVAVKPKVDPDLKVYTDEGPLTRDVKKYLDTLKPQLAYRKMSNRYIPGVSDIVGCYKGKFFAIELKDDVGVESFHQKQYIAEHNAAGGICDTARTLGEVKLILSRVNNCTP